VGIKHIEHSICDHPLDQHDDGWMECQLLEALMSTAATELTIARLLGEEGVRLVPYDDATGKNVMAPAGKLSWGIGFNLMQCGSRGLFEVMLRYLVGLVEAQLVTLSWYSGLPDPVQSVCQDIAYNGGVHGLLNYPHMIAAFAKGDLATAEKECAVADPKLNETRYAPLRAIIKAAA
jgi:hypothetical protein